MSPHPGTDGLVQDECGEFNLCHSARRVALWPTGRTICSHEKKTKNAPHHYSAPLTTKCFKKERNGRKRHSRRRNQLRDSTRNQNKWCDHDSSISFEESTTSLEDCIEHVKRSTREADEKMLTYGITNWTETQKKLKWRHALRIATQSKERWTRKASEWNPRLNKSTNTPRRAGRPAKRQDLNDFVKNEATEPTQSDDLKNDTTWRRRLEEERKTIRQTHSQRLKLPFHCTTSTATPRRDEDPELFIVLLRYTPYAVYSLSNFLPIRYVVVRRVTGGMPYTKTCGPQTFSLREK